MRKVRITKFIIDECNLTNEIIFISDGASINGKYILNGESDDNFIFSDKVLPYRSNSNIPFTFLFKNLNNNYEFINSNIYYFEFELDKISFREEFENENLQIGFMSSMLKKDEISFGDLYSYGLDLKDNCVKLNGICFVLPVKIVKGDIVGLGIEYLNQYLYKVIVTINGYLVEFEHDQGYFKNTTSLKIGMKLNLSYGINFNFGDKPFLFNIKDIINCSNVINLSSNNYFNLGFDDCLINSKKITESRWKSPISVKKFINNLKLSKPLIYKDSTKLL